MSLNEVLREALATRGGRCLGPDGDASFARWVGSVEATMGTTLRGALLDWLRGNLPGTSEDDPDGVRVAIEAMNMHGTAARVFADALVDHVLGHDLDTDPFPGAFADDASDDWHVRHKPVPGSGAPDATPEVMAFSEAAGTALFREAWTYRRNLRDELGWETEDVLPPTPRDSVLVGAELCGRLEAASGMDIWTLHEAALAAHFGPEGVERHRDSPAHGFARFASDMAWKAVGCGDPWSDAHGGAALPRATASYEGEAGLPPAPEGESGNAPSP